MEVSNGIRTFILHWVTISVIAQGDWSCLDRCIMKRTEDHLPCSCQGQAQLIDLGREYFPRYLPSFDCEPSDCWERPYRCKPRMYKVKVLKKRDEQDDSRPDTFLPEALRRVWKFVHVPVSVACVCSI